MDAAHEDDDADATTSDALFRGELELSLVDDEVGKVEVADAVAIGG